MADMMDFPNKFMDFIDNYSFKDEEEVYTNGSYLIPFFRVEQAWNHYMDLFRNAYKYCKGDMHSFGHWCEKLLKDMGELE